LSGKQQRMSTRRKFLQDLRSAGCGVAAGPSVWPRETGMAPDSGTPERGGGSQLVTLFFGGDVMTGRGIDQVLPHPSNPRIHESYVKSALEYMALAERRSGAIRNRLISAGLCTGIEPHHRA
jgi:hypothetical protein